MRQGESMIKVPISKALKVIKGLTGGSSISTDEGLSIMRTHSGYKLMVSASKKSGGDIYLDKEINALMDNGRFDKTSNYMIAEFDTDKLKQVVDTLQRNHNASVGLLPYQLDLIMDEITVDKGTEQISESVMQEVAKEVEARKEDNRILVVTPVQVPPVAVKTKNVKIFSIKARAIKIKLKLAA